jgi:signal peptide peptidase SppA
MPRKNEEMTHPLVFSSFQDQVWAILPAKLEEIIALVEAHLDGKQPSWPQAAAGKSGLGADESYQVEDGVAVLPVYGTLGKRMNVFSQFSGGTSYELLGTQIKQALADPKVSAILLDVDSPGGIVDGVKTLADQIMAVRGQKSIVAFAHGQMCSAAYWLGASADMVIADDTAMVGSIGTVMTHTDRSAADAQAGIKRTHIFSGKYKVAGSDAQPLSLEAQTYLQGHIDYLYQLFLDGVAAGRGRKVKTVQEEMAEGRIFIGKQALKAGLIDQIGNFNDALALARAKGGAMPKNITREVLKAENPELFQVLLAEGAASVTLESLLAKDSQAADKFRVEGVTRERARVLEILVMEGDAKISIAAIEAGTPALEVAPALLKAEKEGRAKSLKDLQAAASPPAGQTVEVKPFTETAGALPIEKQAMKEWDDSKEGPKLKQEFGGQFSTYLAYRQAEVQGQTKR